MFSLPAFLTTFPSPYLRYRQFVKGEALDAERIQAQLSEGWVEIEGLEVDTTEINSLIPTSIPLILESGTLSKVTARVPLSNLWSDPLCLTLDTLSLSFVLSQPSYVEKGKRAARNSPRELHRDLAESVTLAADHFLHEELDAYEEAELDRSIRQSLVLNATDPFNNDEVPGSFPFDGPTSPGLDGQPLPANVESTTILAGLVERILSRLEFKLKNVNIQIRFEDEDHGGIFEIRVAEIKYSDESQSQAPAVGSSNNRTIRSIRLSGVTLHLLPHLQATSVPTGSSGPRSMSTTSRSSSISSTSSSSTGGEYQDMIMSQAVVNLKQSTMSNLDSEASVYMSAISERPPVSIPHILEEAIEDNSSRSPTPTPKSSSKSPEDTMIVTFGSEDIVLRMTTTPPLAAFAEQPSSPQLHPPTTSKQFPSTSLPKIDVGISLGTVATVITPEHLAIILAALQYVSSTGSTQSDPTPAAPAATMTNQPQFNAHVRMKALFASVVYDMSASTDSQYSTNIASFWSKPSSTYIPYGHLRLRLDTLEASHSSKEYIKSHATHRTTRAGHPTLARLPRRASTSIRSGPTLSTSHIRLQDASLFEYLASDTGNDDATDVPPGGAFPVLLFDTNLPRQYDVGPGVSSSSFASIGPPNRPTTDAGGGFAVFPEFDSVDWRNSGLQRKAGGSEKQWKVKQKGKGILKGTQMPDIEQPPVLSLQKDLVTNSTAMVSLSPIHVFVDLSLVERLLPMLRSIAPAVRSAPEITERFEPFASRSLRRPSLPTRHSTTDSIIDDLDAQASSYSTIQATPPAKPVFDIQCPLLRVDIRCPAPVNRRGTWGDGGHLRSGIVTLDMHNFWAKVSSTDQRTGRKAEGTNVMWEKMILFFSRAPERKSSAFIVIGPLAPDPAEIDVSPLSPNISLRSSSSSTRGKTTIVTCRVPSIQAKIKQQTIEGLQFFADDMTHWLDGAFGDGSAPKPRDDLKMIGSRFFGAPGSTRGSSSASSSTDEDDEEELSSTILKLEISETDISLYVPLVDGGERVLALKASDTDVKVESNLAGRHETAFSLNVMDAEFADRTDTVNPTKILGRTTPYTLTTLQQPLVHLRFTSQSNVVAQTKETGISVDLSRLTFFVKSIDWVKDLARFAKTPEGVFEDVVPSEVTRIKVLIQDCSIHAAAPTLGGAVVLVLGVVEVSTDIRSDGEENEVKVSAGRLTVFAVDDLAAVAKMGTITGEVSETWKKAGYAQLAEIISVDLHYLRDLTATEQSLLEILQVQSSITACADSLASFGSLLGDIAKIVPAKPAPPRAGPRPSTLDRSINVFDSIDEQAFNLIPDIVSGSEADMIDDDLPTNLDYLDRASRLSSRQLTSDRITGETLRAWQTDEDEELGSETIKILYDEKFDMDENYWDNLPVLREGHDDNLQIGKIRVRVKDCDAKILLFEGYDWLKTRKAIEDEIRVVRKRLERIRQLLATGQKADESIDFDRATKSVLFNSVYIGLENGQSAGEMDNAALIAAIDEELDDFDDTEKESMNTSWQTLPSAPMAGHQPTSNNRKSKTKLRGRKLTRSKKPQIEISLSSLRAEYDFYETSSSSDLSSELEIKVKEMEILDHIKTSTWKKFLMGMKADSRGNVRETDADMLRIELKGIKFGSDQDEEMRLRAKILPLRLHVDQDALDFLKRFFSFKAPTPQSPASPGTVSATSIPRADTTSPTTSNSSVPMKSNDPFFQHVEIFPIELKLDYKPKRVDFAALREGKTIELMNFFHFDGAEMTLRHITLSGITGWERLGTTLQDLWTPDVKANQLADVISGVSPIRSIVNVGSGVADLILLPIEQYRKDGRLAKGVQRGTNSFVKSTAMEMMKLGAKLATGTQIILEKAENVLGGNNEKLIASVSNLQQFGEGNHLNSWDNKNGSSSEDEDDLVSRYANQPEGVKQGVQAAYKSLSKNVNAAAQTILAVPMEVYERSGDDGPLKAVVRAVPIAVLKPMIGTTEAVSKTLLGMRNSLDPSARRELGDKYK